MPLPPPPPPPTRDTLFYDGACGLCQRSAQFLRALDWLGRLRFLDMTRLPDDELPVPRDAALGGIPMFTRDGHALVGYPAMRRALVQTPLGFLPALLMFVPGISHVGRRIYRNIAENRARALTCDAPPPSTPPSTDARQTG